MSTRQRVKRVLDFIGLMRYEAKVERMARTCDRVEAYSKTHDLTTGARKSEEKPKRK